MRLLAIIALIVVVNVFATDVSGSKFKKARKACLSACASECPANPKALMRESCGSTCMKGKFQIFCRLSHHLST